MITTNGGALSEDFRERLQRSLERIRPYLQIDSGDIEFVRYDEPARVLEIRFIGACATCSLNQMTLRAGVERVLLRDLPEVKRVEAVK